MDLLRQAFYKLVHRGLKQCMTHLLQTFVLCTFHLLSKHLLVLFYVHYIFSIADSLGKKKTREDYKCSWPENIC